MRDGFIFHFENEEELEELTLEEQGIIFAAMRKYAKDGIEPQFEDKALRLAWKPIRRRLDSDTEAYEKTCERNRTNGNKGGRPKNPAVFLENPENPAVFSENPENPAVFSVFDEKPKKPDTEYDTDTESDTEKKESIRTPAREAAKKHGKYGWVKLTDSQYSKLCTDLGLEEAERCICYVDESAQSTGNKNKWRDWNLVIRRCSRDKWGVNATGARDRPQNKFINFKQRDNDIDALAAKLAVNSMNGRVT